MGELFTLANGLKEKEFTLREAKKLLPIVRRITTQAAEKVVPLQTRIKEHPLHSEQDSLCARQIRQIINRWAEKIRRLGAMPTGLWNVEFHNGNGFYCWEYPDEEVGFFHKYRKSEEQRTPKAF